MTPIDNINGRHLSAEEITNVVETRCVNIGIQPLSIEVVSKSTKKALVTFLCSICNKKVSRSFNSINAYKLTHCKICGHAKKQGRFERIIYTKDILQKIINEGYKHKDIGFHVLEDFTYKNNKQVIEIECTACGKQQPSRIDLLLQKRKSCTFVQMRSKLEVKVNKILMKHDEVFEKEYGFEDLRNIQPLRYDFAVFKNNRIFLIECDGIQHFYPTFGKVSFERTQLTDEIKNQYAIKNGIPLLRIPYNTKKSVEKTVLEFINS